MLAAAVAAALALPAVASAHAILLHTSPQASAALNSSPDAVQLTFSEVVEPRFAVVSVTDAGGHSQATGVPRHSPADPYTLEVPVQHMREGWYLVFWRAISADGHPVRGVFTFDVGPNPGPEPEFAVPKLTETAATPALLVARWVAFLSLLAALGLFVLRIATARALVARVEGTRLRELSLAFGAALAVALVAVPVYVEVATAKFALTSAWRLGAVVPLLTGSAFGRGFLDLELMLALFGFAAFVAIRLDRPERPRRSLAALFALGGAALAGGAVLLAPSAAGHAAQTAPRPLSILLDWLHLVSASVWIGGLVGLVVVWRSLPVARRTAGLAVCVPRFSNTALVSVLVLAGSGTAAAIVHLPTLASLWQTGYGKTIVLQASLLLGAAALASANQLGKRFLPRFVLAETLLVAGAVFAAALLSSLPPPPRALAGIGSPSAHTGPGPVTSVVQSNGYRLEFHVDPNRVGLANDFAVRISRGGAPVEGATVTATFTMLDMEMPTQTYALADKGGGLYERGASALVMVGRWGLAFSVTPPGRPPFQVLLFDRADG